MWIARDKYGKLNLFSHYPSRCDCVGGDYYGDKISPIPPCTWKVKNPYGGFYSTFGYIEIDKDLFEELTWEDEPIEVNVNITKAGFNFKLKEETIKALEKSTGKPIEELRKMKLKV